MFENVELVVVEELDVYIRLDQFSKKGVLEFINDINEIVKTRGHLLPSDLYFELEKAGACMTFPGTRYDLIFPDTGNSVLSFTHQLETIKIAGLSEPVEVLVIRRNTN